MNADVIEAGAARHASGRGTVIGVNLLGAGARLVRRFAGVAEPRQRLRATELRVAADVDGALLASAAVLRRLGATITRYETEDGLLEARPRDGDGAGRITLTVTAESDSVARMRLESDATDARRWFRRFKRELGRKETA